jgi:mono/diheme cytochrome c family protein
MGRRIGAVSLLIWLAAFAAVGAQANAWKLPPAAADEKNPVAVTPASLAEGRRLYRANCARCHGPQGKGNGSDADPKHKHHMDLTRAAGAEGNPDGVVFHKVMNGRTNPKMPAFKEKLTAEQVWTLVAFVQSLREKS